MGRPKTIVKTKLRSFINFMAQEIFDATIKNYKNKRLAFDFNFKDEIIRLNINIDYNASVGGIYSEGFDVWGNSSDEDIIMYICVFTHNFKNTSYNEFNASVREFLRHELEHIAQYHECPGKAEIYGYPIPNNSLEYFIHPSEIDAFLHGINYKRKYLKTNIIDEINTLLRNYYNIQDSDIIIIQKIWFKRLEEILPHTL